MDLNWYSVDFLIGLNCSFNWLVSIWIYRLLGVYRVNESVYWIEKKLNFGFGIFNSFKDFHKTILTL